MLDLHKPLKVYTLIYMILKFVQYWNQNQILLAVICVLKVLKSWLKVVDEIIDIITWILVI